MALPPYPQDEDAGDDSGLVAKARPGDNAEPLSVSDLANRLKRAVEDQFGFVRLRGELSGVKRAASGHLYCALKDDKAVIDGVMWRGQASRLAFVPEDGLEVIATGKLTTYPGRSKYQIVMEGLELAGEGALLALLEKTRRRLEAEGLFAAERKRPIPFLPRVIGVVTSPTGAVIRDILHRLADRFPSHVLVWPVLVQGSGAAGQVAAAVNGFNALPAGGRVPRPDLLIVARGGGSIEDLWAFNEEPVVRAIAASNIPVISAVGHETDTTLADFAADRRAPTPTAAAEMAVPVRADLAALLAELSLRARRGVRRPVQLGRERLEARARLLPAPAALLAVPAQRLDELGERLRRGLKDQTAIARQRLSADGVRLSAPLLRLRLTQAGERLERAALRPAILWTQHGRAAERLAAGGRVLRSLDPAAPLARGYALVRDAAGAVVTRAEVARTAARLQIAFADGAVEVAPLSDETLASPPSPRAPAARRGPRRAVAPAGQSDLFGPG